MEEFFEFDIPDSFLSQLNEFSGGGYMLFILDAEKNVRIYGKVDEVTSESHLNTQIKGWADAQEEINKQNILESQTERYEGTDDDDDDDDDDDNFFLKGI